MRGKFLSILGKDEKIGFRQNSVGLRRAARILLRWELGLKIRIFARKISLFSGVLSELMQLGASQKVSWGEAQSRCWPWGSKSEVPWFANGFVFRPL